jgi:hypothetical protein
MNWQKEDTLKNKDNKAKWSSRSPQRHMKSGSTAPLILNPALDGGVYLGEVFSQKSSN